MSEAAPVLEDLDVPAPHAWLRGRFFPGPCQETHSAWERIGDGPAIRARHIPIMHEVLRARMRFGPAAEPMLAAWRNLWCGAVPDGDLDTHARERGMFVTEASRERKGRLLDKAGLALREGRTSTAAQHAMSALGGDDHVPVRHPSFHVLEEAATHLALAASGLPFAIGVASAEGSETYVPDGRGGLARHLPADPVSMMARAGMESTRRAGNPYWTMKAFRDRAGRGMAIAHGLDHLQAILIDMALQGHVKAFVKGAASKTGTWVVDIAGLAPGGVRDRLHAAMGDACVDLLSDTPRRRTVLVQEFTPFVREHRFVVVRNRVVASTPSDRDLSVLDVRTDRILRDEVARLDHPAEEPGAFDRGGARTERDRALVARMAAGARDLARAMGAEFAERHRAWQMRPDSYCIDMGETVDGRVLPIEVNTLLNCGLYALDQARVIRAYERRAAWRQAMRERGDGSGGGGDRFELPRPAPEAVRVRLQDPPVPATALPRLVERYVEEAFGGRHVPLVLRYAREHEAAIKAYVAARSPGIAEFELRREATFFEPWKDPAWEGPWREWLRAQGGARLASARPAFGVRLFEWDPYDVVLEIGCEPDAVAAALGLPGSRRWLRRSTLPLHDPAKPVVIVRAEADQDCVDWEMSLLAQVLEEDSLRAPVILRPGARVRIVSAQAVTEDGYRGVDLGDLAGAMVDA